VRLSNWLLPISLLAGAQCSNGLGPENFPVVTTVNRPAFRIGEGVDITVEVINQTESTQDINANQCPAKFLVLGADGSIVGPGSSVCTLAAITLHLPPGQKAAFTFGWRGEARNPNSFSEIKFLPPGPYRIQGFAAVGGVGRVDGSIIDVVIQP
jgi:hypothetical protein